MSRQEQSDGDKKAAVWHWDNRKDILKVNFHPSEKPKFI